MTRYLLDANALSVLSRQPRGSIAKRVRQVGFASLCTSIVVVSEIRFGLLLKDSAALEASMMPILETIEIEPFETPADIRYAELRCDLQRRGTPIGANDMLIAAHALALDCTLVTANTGEFERVQGLKIENWLVD